LRKSGRYALVVSNRPAINIRCPEYVASKLPVELARRLAR